MEQALFVLCLCALYVDLFDYRKGAGVYDDAPGARNACGLFLPWQCIISKKANASY